jgi:UDP-galactopyranose mutase
MAPSHLPHQFKAFAYLSKFAWWRPYEHRVLASLSDGRRVPIPVNRTTLNALFDANLSTDADVDAFLRPRGAGWSGSQFGRRDCLSGRSQALRDRAAAD